MKPIKGLNLDVRPEEQPEGTYPFGKNGIQRDLNGAVTNELGFKKIIGSCIPSGYQHNGTIETDNNRVIIFFTNNVNSCIKLVDVVTESVIHSFSDEFLAYKLGFNADNYITGVTQRNYIGELVCAFTDKVTFPKFYNFVTPNVNQLKDWNLFPECDHPTLTKTPVAGGYIPVGSVFFATRYYKQDGTRTSFSSVSSGLVITSPDNEQYADKAVQLVLTGMDQAYDFIEIAVISRVAGVTSAKLLKKLPVLPGTFTTSYTGNELYEDISLEEVLVPQPSYDKVHTMAQLNDALYLGRLEKNKIVVDMQRYASMVKIFWESQMVDVMNATDDIKDGRKKGFMHGESYAFYIRYRLSNGSFSTAFHIPGPAAIPADIALSAVAITGGVGNAFVYEAEDTISTFSIPDLTGIPGVYLNKTELYPLTQDFDSSAIGGENLQGTQVRHHKMPSQKWCKEVLYSAETTYGTKKLDLLGIKALNIIIPPEYQSLITGYEILYAKRTVQNMTEYGQGLLLYGGFQTFSDGSSADPVSVFSLGHNWNLQQGINTGFAPLQNRMRFHGFDVLMNKPGIKPSFIAAQYRLQGYIDTKYVSFSYPTGSPGDSYGNNCVLVDMTIGNVSNSVADNINGIESSKYLTNNLSSNEYINQYMEACLAAKLVGTPLPLTVSSDDPDFKGQFQGDFEVEAHMISLNDIKENIYESFYTQELVSAGDPLPIGTINTFWGGDIFVNPYTFHTYGVADQNWASHYDNGTDISDPEFRGRRVVHRFICETVGNLWTRFEVAGNSYSKWYDHNPLPGFGTTVNWESVYPVPFNGQIDPNQIGYSKGAEAINDFIPDDIFNPYREYQTKFPYRVHRGGKLSRQNTRSWRTFLALDYYECQKNMGFIEHLEGMDDRLLIHHANALFLTQDKTKLESGLLSVTLGTGDIFQFEPQEAQSSKLGYAGTQHDLACIRTPLGYVFPDSKQGEIYMYKNQRLSSLNPGLVRFLSEYLKIMGNNTYMGNGITLGWDQEYKRILATVKNIRPASGTPIEVIDDISDIIDIVGLIGPVNIDSVLVLKDGRYIIPGTIVFFQGKFMKYEGPNDLDPTYDCPPVTPDCDPVTGLSYDLTETPLFNHIFWDDMGPGTLYQWVLYRVDQGALTQLYSGTTMNTFRDFDQFLIDPEIVYFFQVTRICSPGVFSTPASVVFSVSTEPIIIIPPIGVVGLWILPRNLPQYHPSSPTAINAQSPFPACTCGGTNLTNAWKFEVEINGNPIGSVVGTGGTGCYQPGGLGWTHAPNNSGGGGFFSVNLGPLDNCTLKITVKDKAGNPADFNSGGIGNNFMTPNGGHLLKTDLTPVAPVITGSNNHIFTYSNVHIDPTIPFVNATYLPYCYIYFYT